MKSEKKRRLWLIPVVLLILFASYTVFRAVSFKNLKEAPSLTNEQALELEKQLSVLYPERSQVLHPLSYNIQKPALDLTAEAAILIDVSNGTVLFEKNADEVIPPASMTKLFAMFVVEEEVRAGHLKYEDLIPLPPESWACNMPPHSSLMFLGEGQKVTLEELLLGLSICSGNDAAYALAYKVCGNMPDFVARMNKVAWDLGLIHTSFVESSGYSELNTTTAREMALFCRIYLNRHPKSLERFHSVKTFTYPKEKNLAPGDRPLNQDFSQGIPQHITMPVTQKNTNPLLGKLEGCDGLKTGYIDESGYNLSLTAVRGKTRYLSVTMKGKGSSTAEGQANRVKDGTALMEWAFYTFADASVDFLKPYFVKVYGAAGQGVNLIPVYNEKTICVPFVSGTDAAECASRINFKVHVPENLSGRIECGTVFGKITVEIDGYTIAEISLASDRSLKKASFITALADFFVSQTL